MFDAAREDHVIQLIYLSDLVGTDDSRLDTILESAARHNREDGITGMLLYANGNFMQVLEGDATAVHRTYARIAKDPRHKNLTILLEEQIATRQFEGWSMGFRSLSEETARRLPNYAPYFRYGFDRGAITARPGIALDLLRLFSKGTL